MNFATIKPRDIANGPGVRTTLFVSGCTHRCPGCFNEIAWDFNYGEPFTKDTEDYLLSQLDSQFVEGFSLLGGEPFEPQNQRGIVGFLKRLKDTYPTKNTWCYTGYTFEDLLNPEYRAHCEVTREMLENIDILVDGKFEESLKSLDLRFRGSSNQRIIDVQKSLEAGKTVLWDGALTNKESFKSW